MQIKLNDISTLSLSLLSPISNLSVPLTAIVNGIKTSFIYDDYSIIGDHADTSIAKLFIETKISNNLMKRSNELTAFSELTQTVKLTSTNSVERNEDTTNSADSMTEDPSITSSANYTISSPNSKLNSVSQGNNSFTETSESFYNKKELIDYITKFPALYSIAFNEFTKMINEFTMTY